MNSTSNNSGIDKKVLKEYVSVAIAWAILVVVMTLYFSLYAAELLYVNEQITIEFNSTMYSVNSLTQAISNGTITDINGAYKAIMSVSYPLIDFSTMFFLGKPENASDWLSAWNTRVTNISTTYVYVFISMLITYIAMVFYILIIIQLGVKHHQSLAMGLSTKYPSYSNNLWLFTTKMYLDFIIIISVFFAFFSLVSTIIMLIYMLVIFSSFYILNKIKDKTYNKLDNIVFKKTDLQNFYSLIIIMLILNGYLVLQSLFITWFNVDIGLVLSAFFSVGTLAVLVGVFVKNLLSSNVGAINKGIKTINAQIDGFQVFYHMNSETCIDDYTFVRQLPLFIRKDVIANKIDKNEVKNRIKLLEEMTILYRNNFKKTKQRNFMLYRLYNQIATIDEVKDIEYNLGIIKNYKK